MESNGESSGVFYGNRTTENSNPNVCLKALSSPSIRKSAIKSQNSASKNNRFNPTQVASPPAEKSAPKIPTTVASPPTQKSASKNSSTNPTLVASPSPHKKIRQRKFLVAKRNPKRETAETCAAASLACKCNSGGGEHRCMCVAYDGLRASQEDFFKNHTTNVDGGITLEELKMYDGTKIEPDNWFPSIYSEKQGSDEREVFDEMGVSNIKRSRELWPEEAGEKAAGPSSGRVLHLVKAFEKLLSPAKSNDADENHEKTDKDDAKRAFSPPDILLTYERLGLESPSSSSLKSSQGRRSSSDRRSRRKSAGSAGTLSRRHCKRRQVKTTSQEPFKLRTEQRGKCKEEKFFTKIKQMMEEEEKQRVPIAQGLPWTTEEPECLAKPPVKDSTRSIDLVLRSDVRAVERAEFDYHVAEKLNLIEQYKAERERQKKLAEEDAVRRLRKELVPKAHPVPYFDKPFVPQRSEKPPTMPKEPRFHVPHNQKMIKSGST